MSRWQSASLAAVVALILGFYYWTATSGSDAIVWRGPKFDYYNLLTRGFLKGHLYLDVEVTPRLLALRNPYDPEANAGLGVMHDVSLYRGRYYLYFGVTPAVLVFLPWRLLTGLWFPPLLANLLFCSLGFVASTALVVALWRSIRAGDMCWRSTAICCALLRRAGSRPGMGLWR